MTLDSTSINSVVEHSHCLLVVCGCFHTAELSCDTVHRECQASDIYNLALYSLPTLTYKTVEHPAGTA